MPFSDLNHSNQYVVSLALCALGNIASVEMSRDLFSEVENLIATANPYTRRKAALCAMRICRKVPDLQEHFIERAKTLLSDRNHGVLLCGLTLVTSLCEADQAEGDEQDLVSMFRPLTGLLVKTLKSLASSGYTPEHDVAGITDPFLQVKILQLLRVLGRGDVQTSEQINDILAQVLVSQDGPSCRTWLSELLSSGRSPRTRIRRRTSVTRSSTKPYRRFSTLKRTLVCACSA